MKKCKKSECSSSSSSDSELKLFGYHSVEQVHLNDKLCSSVSSICQISFCTSAGIILCVPSIFRCWPCSSEEIASSSSGALFVSRIEYPLDSTERSSSTDVLLEEMKTKQLKDVYQRYKNDPKCLSSFDGTTDANEGKGFRRCSFCPKDIRRSEMQSLLATITYKHQLLIYEILSTSIRFSSRQSANLKFNLTKNLLENIDLQIYLKDSTDCRFVHFHLTCSILWNENGTILFQLQYSGHLIIWIFDEKEFFPSPTFSIIDTKICKGLSMCFNEQFRMLIISGKENQRVLIELDQMKLSTVKSRENDFTNVEDTLLIELNSETLLFLQSKMHRLFIETIDIGKRQENEVSFLFSFEFDIVKVISIGRWRAT